MPSSWRLGRRGPPFSWAIVFSFFINLFGLCRADLHAAGLRSRADEPDLATLAALTLIVAFIYATTAVLAQPCVPSCSRRSGFGSDQTAHADVFRAVQKASAPPAALGARHAQCLKDIDTIREFYTGSGLLPA